MPSDAEIEAAARAIFVDRRGHDPDWPVGVDKLGYHQGEYVAYVPSWKWFYERSARAALEAAEKVRAAAIG